MDNFVSNKNRVFIKSKHRVQKHGEVFTPQWVIDKMIAIPGIKEKAEDVFATFLEPTRPAVKAGKLEELLAATFGGLGE